MSHPSPRELELARRALERGERMRAAGIEEMAIGAFLEAAEAFRRAGLRKDAADAWFRARRTDLAAEALLADGDRLGAARMWAKAGEARRAAALYRELGRPGEAAEAFDEAGDYLTAADLWLRLKENRRAGRSLLRAGRCAEALEALGAAASDRGDPLELAEWTVEALEAGARVTVSSERAVSGLHAAPAVLGNARLLRRLAALYERDELYEPALQAWTRLRDLPEFRDEAPSAIQRIRAEMTGPTRRPGGALDLDSLDLPDPSTFAEQVKAAAPPPRPRPDGASASRSGEALASVPPRGGDPLRSDPTAVPDPFAPSSSPRSDPNRPGLGRTSGSSASRSNPPAFPPEPAPAQRPVPTSPQAPVAGAAPPAGAGVQANAPASIGPSAGGGAAARSGGAFHAGSVLAGRYRLDAVLGAGAMGQVWSATHLALERRVAVKVLLPAPGSEAQEREGLFMREARASSKLYHPNVVQILDFGRDDAGGGLYLVMEFLSGRPLSSLIRDDHPVPPHRAIDLTQQILSAIEAAHAVKILHRDVKPGNVMVLDTPGRPDFVKVVDFGIARAMEPGVVDSLNATREGMVRGTPVYMAPEQAMGGPLDARADLYAAATVLFELLFGRPPFSGGEVIALLYNKIHVDPDVPAQAADGRPVPAELRRVMARALAKDPDGRYPTCADLRLALEPYGSPGFWRSYAGPPTHPAAAPVVPETLFDANAPTLPPQPSPPLAVPGTPGFDSDWGDSTSEFFREEK